MQKPSRKDISHLSPATITHSSPTKSYSLPLSFITAHFPPTWSYFPLLPCLTAHFPPACPLPAFKVLLPISLLLLVPTSRLKTYFPLLSRLPLSAITFHFPLHAPISHLSHAITAQFPSTIPVSHSLLLLFPTFYSHNPVFPLSPAIISHQKTAHSFPLFYFPLSPTISTIPAYKPHFPLSPAKYSESG